MKIGRRNTLYFAFTFIPLGLMLIPIILVFNLFPPFAWGATDYILSLLIFSFFGAITYFFYKRDSLKKEEIEYLEKHSIQIIEKKINDDTTTFLFIGILFLNMPGLYSEKNNFLFIAYVGFSFFIIGIILYRKWKGENFSIEKLYLTESQIILKAQNTKVINWEDVKTVNLERSELYIKEKYGELIFDMKPEDLPQLKELIQKIKALPAANSIEFKEFK